MSTSMMITTKNQRDVSSPSSQDSGRKSTVMTNNDKSPNTLSPSTAARLSTQWSIKTLPDFSDAEFETWKLLLEEKTGIHLVPQQKAFLQAQLTIRLRELGGISLT